MMEDYDSMTKKELIAKAKEAGLKASTSTTKAEIIGMLKAKFAPAPPRPKKRVWSPQLFRFIEV